MCFCPERLAEGLPRVIPGRGGHCPGHTSEKMWSDRHGYAKWSAGSNKKYHSMWTTLPIHSSQSVAQALRATDGNFLAEKEHVRSDMEQRLHALAEDRVLTQKEKERVITTAVCSVFRQFSYSAGFVVWPVWTNAELDHISKMWTRTYKQAWTISSSTDSSPFIEIYSRSTRRWQRLSVRKHHVDSRGSRGHWAVC